MGAIEDIRKVMQDFLAPELRAIEERLKNLGSNLKDFRQAVDKQFDKIDTQFIRLETSLNLESRVKRIEESQRSAHPESQ